ncbi:FRG domain protein [Gemmatirosa kalamazoonensis]|uniref:FRG domain protein n=1 Tax=Gemmatirosa kalamazoonensis TaxID=861299 RepID=W0RQU1_9BACT|nr:FRG domain-containing protein [Gemmatirosa kalamazoonensis]AHG91933.1 FRG domain protein [Gemmatirosa kalamazoonensis]
MAKISTIELKTLGELLDHVTPREPDPVTGRRRDSGVYRGSGHAEWPLLTSLDRLGGIHPPHTKSALEEHILRNFIRYSRPYFPTPRNEWELLVAAQHHGLPTRLLDWTYSPLVAAHFATLRPHAADRVVWRLDWQRVHRHFGFPPLALLSDDLAALNHDPDAGGLTPWDLMRSGAKQKPFAVLFEPPTLDARLATQAAAFTISSTTTQSFDEFLAKHELLDALTKYVIPAERVDVVRDQLDIATIDERRLFPDLDGVAAQMRRYYS